MMSRLRPLWLCACLLLAAPALAVIETYEFSNPELEVRYRQLSQELRCPKCQNQNIADSNAPIAQDLRKVLHRQLEEGATDEQILAHMVDRYGEFVRYRPRFGGATAVLWLAPVLLLLAALAVLVIALRARPGRVGPRKDSSALTAGEKARLDALLDEAGRDP